MCISIVFKDKKTYYGRNMDLEYTFGQRVVVTPRNYKWKWKKANLLKDKFYGLVGIATVVDGYPLYADAVNEQGLFMAGLNYPDRANYFEYEENKINVSPFELIPYFLTQFKTVKEAREALENLNILNEPFSPSLPLATLHFILSDGEETVVLESDKDGLHIHENDIGVLTNNPGFESHRINLENYMNLRVDNPKESYNKNLKPYGYCKGLGSFGLPGDLSSMSRFVRGAFYKSVIQLTENENENVKEVMRVLDLISVPKGSMLTDEGKWEITLYSSCLSKDEKTYYFKTYDNPNLRKVSLNDYDLEFDKIYEISMDQEFTIPSV